jgi:hypothetical protein
VTNDIELIEEIKAILEIVGVEVIMVDAPVFKFEGKELKVFSRKCGQNYRQDILDTVVQDNIKRVFLYNAEKMQIGNETRVMFRANW